MKTYMTQKLNYSLFTLSTCQCIHSFNQTRQRTTSGTGNEKNEHVSLFNVLSNVKSNILNEYLG